MVVFSMFKSSLTDKQASNMFPQGNIKLNGHGNPNQGLA